MKKIAFNTANLVARYTGYRFELKNWGQQDQITREKTDEKQWDAICREIAAAGYSAVEIWAAHVDPKSFTDARAKTYEKILKDNGLTPIGLGGSLTDENARVCRQLGIQFCNGGLWGTDLASVHRVHKATGIKLNYENHPEKSVEEILKAIEGGDDVGIALDTGWLGTQGVDAPVAIRSLGQRIRHVHLKDVQAAGGHETVPLGTGVVNIDAAIKTLKEIGYSGWYSWEDEPEQRNPFDIAVEMRKYIEARV